MDVTDLDLIPPRSVTVLCERFDRMHALQATGLEDVPAAGEQDPTGVQGWEGVSDDLLASFLRMFGLDSLDVGTFRAIVGGREPVVDVPPGEVASFQATLVTLLGDFLAAEFGIDTDPALRAAELLADAVTGSRWDDAA